MPDWLDDLIADSFPSEPNRRRKPVKWLSVRQLMGTAFDVAQATSFAKYADRREAMASSPREFYQLCLPVSGSEQALRSTVSVDYVADTGDGFDATFATARCISRGAVVPDDRAERADLLVLGGDEVYPVASAREYEDRFSSVLRRAALIDEVTGRPPVLALPGNHDWYDGLAAFRRIFCESRLRRIEEEGDPRATGVALTPVPPGRDEVGGWGAFQSRSYFAIQLTPDWWLWAVDSQLDTPLDVEQMSYFKSAARHIVDSEARIILCAATPSWLEAEGTTSYAAHADTPFFTLLWFVDRTLGQAERHRIRLVLTGDEHHYARYAPTAAQPSPGGVFAPELVTCGGGGAYLASTHHLARRLTFDPLPWIRARRSVDETSQGDSQSLSYTRERCYPSTARSIRMSFTGLVPALWRNGFTLPLLLAAANAPLLAAIALHPRREWLHAWQFWVPLGAAYLLLIAYAQSGNAKYHDVKSKRWALALCLATGHSAAQFGVTLLTAFLLTDVWPLAPPGTSWPFWIAAVPILAVLGMVVFLLYLRVADLFRCHTTEAFSALQIRGYKSNLRLVVTKERIDVRVVVMDSVPRAWRWTKLRAIATPQARVLETFKVARDPDPALCVPPAPPSGADPPLVGAPHP